MRHFLLIVSMILFLSACESKRDNIVVNQLTKELSISAFSDSSFFSLIPCMVEYEGDIYISDIIRNDIVVLDSLLLLKKNIASSGRGPEEIISGSYFEISNDTILIGDVGNRRYQLFNINGNHIKSISFQGLNIDRYSSLRFIYNDGILYTTSRDEDEKAIVGIDIEKREIINTFGDKYQFENEFQKIIRNKRNLSLLDNYIISTSNNMPYIEKYDSAGNLLEKYSLLNIAEIKETIQYIETQNYNENQYFILFQDSYLFRDKLYILLSYKTNSDNWMVNNIFEFDVKDKIFLIRKLILPSRIYMSFCVNSEWIYAFNDVEVLIEKIRLN